MIGWIIFTFWILFAVMIISMKILAPDRCISPHMAKSLMSSCSILQILTEGKTMDLIGVYTPNTVCSSLVKLFTGTRWAHIGILYRDEQDELFVLEVIAEDYWSHMMSREVKAGIKKTRFENFVRHCWRENRSLVWVPVQIDVHDKFVSLYESTKESVYLTQNPFHFMKATVKRPFDEKKKLPKSIICTELIVYYLQELNMLHKRFDPSSYHPGELLFELGQDLKARKFYGNPKFVEK